MKTLEQEFEDFYQQSYGTVQVPEGLKREIKMNFYSGAYICSIMPRTRAAIKLEAHKWIEGYIRERKKEREKK